MTHQNLGKGQGLKRLLMNADGEADSKLAIDAMDLYKTLLKKQYTETARQSSRWKHRKGGGQCQKPLKIVVGSGVTAIPTMSGNHAC